MKKSFIFVIFGLVIMGCSSAPQKKLMKNCEAAGSGLYYCEDIPQKELGERR